MATIKLTCSPEELEQVVGFGMDRVREFKLSIMPSNSVSLLRVCSVFVQGRGVREVRITGFLRVDVIDVERRLLNVYEFERGTRFVLKSTFARGWTVINTV